MCDESVRLLVRVLFVVVVVAVVFLIICSFFRFSYLTPFQLFVPRFHAMVKIT